MSRLTRLWVLASLLLVATSVPAHAVELEATLKYLPQSANSLAILKIQDLVKSPLGVQEEWAKKHQTQFMAGSVHIPPSVDFVIRAFEFHPEDTRVTKSYGVAAMKTPVAMSRLASHEKAHIEMVAGHAAVHTNRNSFFAELAPGLVGGVSPGYRQNLARWLREVDSDTVPAVSAYLKEVATNVGDAQVVLALDFQDLVDPLSWRSRIKSSPAVLDKPNAVTTLTQLADGLRGIALKIHVTDKTTATIVMDFNTVVSQTAKPFLKPVLMDLLGEAGATLDDIDQGEVDAKGKTATITFALSDTGLRQVMSMILMPTLSEPSGEAATESVAAADPNKVTTGTQTAGKVSLPATRAYYAAINQVFDDLDKMLKKGGNYNRSAVWHDNFASKIEQLSIRNVDPDLVSYGQKVSSNLRALAVSLRGVPIEVNKLQGSVTYNVQYQPAGFYNSNWSIWSTVAWQPAAVNVETNQAQIRGEQAKAIAAGAKQREEIWQIMATDRQQIRVKLNEKFGRDFETQP